MSAEVVDEQIALALRGIKKAATLLRSDGEDEAAEQIMRAGRHFERTRFHEKHNYWHWKKAQARIDALEIEEWGAEDGDTRCQLCGRPNPVWWAVNEDWNRIMRDSGEELTHAILCPTCFMLKDTESIWSIASNQVARHAQ